MTNLGSIPSPTFRPMGIARQAGEPVVAGLNALAGCGPENPFADIRSGGRAFEALSKITGGDPLGRLLRFSRHRVDTARMPLRLSARACLCVGIIMAQPVVGGITGKVVSRQVSRAVPATALATLANRPMG